MSRGVDFATFAARVKQSSGRVRLASVALQRVAGDIVETNLTVGGAYSPGTPVDTGEALSGWERKKAGVTETFTNSVPYIRRLEYGHSAQAPNGFMRLTVLHWKDIVRDARAIVARGGRGGMYAE